MSAAERCQCGATADYRCESTKVGPARQATGKGGAKIVIRPYIEFYRCAACVRVELSSEAPSRKVEALPHYAAALRQQAKEAADALVGAAEQPRFDEDWGRR